MFLAHDLEKPARRAVCSKGMRTVHKFEIVNCYKMLAEDDPNYDLVVIRAYNKRGDVVEVSAWDIYYFTECSDWPMARVSK